MTAKVGMTSVADLANSSTIDKPVNVKVPYRGRFFVCKLEPTEDGRIMIRTDVIPKRYHVNGLLYGGHDETDKGVEIEEFLMKRDLSPTYWENRISYARAVVGQPSNGLVAKVQKFVADVSEASAEVEQMLIEYITGLPSTLDPKFERYKKAV